jgi:hypothetical protein
MQQQQQQQHLQQHYGAPPPQQPQQGYGYHMHHAHHAHHAQPDLSSIDYTVPLQLIEGHVGDVGQTTTRNGITYQVRLPNMRRKYLEWEERGELREGSGSFVYDCR